MSRRGRASEGRSREISASERHLVYAPKRAALPTMASLSQGRAPKTASIDMLCSPASGPRHASCCKGPMNHGHPDERLLLKDALLLVAHGLPLAGAIPSELELVQPSPSTLRQQAPLLDIRPARARKSEAQAVASRSHD